MQLALRSGNTFTDNDEWWMKFLEMFFVDLS